MDTGTWKSHERKIARFFGSERNSLSGINSKISHSDSIHPRLYIECKSGKKYLNEKLWLDTLKKAQDENKIPMVVSTKLNQPDSLILCRLKDLKKISIEVKK